jgi:GNAT superfamily N-acetyltransferase
VLRAASKSDWSDIERLLRALGLTDGQSSEQLRLRFLQFISRADHCIRVVEISGRLVGYAWAQDLGPHLRSGNSIVRLHDLWVDDEARRRGVGRELFEGVRGWASARSARWLQWHAGRTANEFYAALGIAPTPSEDDTHPFYEIEFDPSSAE